MAKHSSKIDCERVPYGETVAAVRVASHAEGALCRLRMSVNSTGRIDFYPWLFFLAQHARRHLAQNGCGRS
jgi:hypothetical protein